ncbi:MAG: hypothetical protein RR767_06435 [Acinetobacter sp.]
MENKLLEIFNLSNIQTNFKIIKYCDTFYLNVYLEYGFEEIEKIVEINSELFDYILNYKNQFDIYSVKSIFNTKKLKIENFISLSCTVYIIDGLYFLEKWQKFDNSLIVKTIADQIDSISYLGLV